MKKAYKFSNKKKPAITENQYTNKAKHQSFAAPEYWFRKNKNLNVMNFRMEDNIPQNDTEHHLGYA